MERLSIYNLRMLYAPGMEMREQADLIINSYEKSKKEFEEEIQESKTKLNKFNKELEELLKNIHGRPVKDKFEHLLSTHKINYTQHFTMTLTGENCHRWLINHKQILEGLKLILIEGLEIQGE